MGLTAPDSNMIALLDGRRIAALATENDDGSIQLTAVWYLFADGHLYVATFSRSRKARNVAARPKASLMVDTREGGADRGVTAMGRAELVSGDEAHAINERIHRRYLSEAALADPQIGPGFAAFDDVTIRITPREWLWWDTAEVDTNYFGGKLCGTPGYLLPLE
ncbi:MAG: TIGR03618 family F420-dependent PPOX class oxidoreductase [Candidatus Acidiferrales bacterium]